MTLAVAEHWFLVAPLHANALWSWGVKDGHGQEDAERATNMHALSVDAVEASRMAGQI
jgi:hypothetical protein